MTDDERARALLQSMQHPQCHDDIQRVIAALRDERRRVWKEAANQAAKGAHVWSCGIGNHREEQALLEFANYCRRQAEEETT